MKILSENEPSSSSSSSLPIVHPVVREDQENVEIRATNDSNLASRTGEATLSESFWKEDEGKPKTNADSFFVAKPVTSTPHQSPDDGKFYAIAGLVRVCLDTVLLPLYHQGMTNCGRKA